MNKVVTFKSGWFTASRYASIVRAFEMTKGPGGELRIASIDSFKESVSRASEADTFLPDDFNITPQTIKAWAIGIIEAWREQTRTDYQCRTLKDAAIALRCWGVVEKNLPKVEVEEGFEVDSELEAEEIALDESDA